jgi:hypothetical protein
MELWDFMVCSRMNFTSAFILNSSKSVADGKDSGRGFPRCVCCCIPMRRLWSVSTFMWTEWAERKAWLFQFMWRGRSMGFLSVAYL